MNEKWLKLLGGMMNFGNKLLQIILLSLMTACTEETGEKEVKYSLQLPDGKKVVCENYSFHNNRADLDYCQLQQAEYFSRWASQREWIEWLSSYYLNSCCEDYVGRVE